MEAYIPHIAVILYLLTAIILTVWVARTLHSNGRIFLIEAFHGNEEMADAVNKLLVVGFYLINIGFVALFLRIFEKPETVLQAMEYVATKVGVVLIVLGGMHFFNMFNFDKMRRKGRRPIQQAPAQQTPVAEQPGV